jgi:hypothetical protein
MSSDVGISPKSFLCRTDPFPESECMQNLWRGNHSHIYFVFNIGDEVVRFTELAQKSGCLKSSLFYLPVDAKCIFHFRILYLTEIEYKLNEIKELN